MTRNTDANTTRPTGKIRKAVFPVGGLGTRFLPATKVIPKEMLTIVDRPAIQYAVDEAMRAGIEDLIFVTGRNKGVIEDYFDFQYELCRTLAEGGKDAEVKRLLDLQPEAGKTSFTRQQVPLGLGHAVWCARDLVGDEPFALLLPDMILKGDEDCLAGMLQLYEKTGGNVIAVQECDPADTHRYGIVGRGADLHNGFRVTEMVEKPAPGTAPSNLFINGRYILQPGIFDALENQPKGHGGEVQLTDALLGLIEKGEIHGFEFKGRCFDCGVPTGFVQANIAFAMGHKDLRGDVLDFMKEVLAAEEAGQTGARHGHGPAPERGASSSADRSAMAD